VKKAAPAKTAPAKKSVPAKKAAPAKTAPAKKSVPVKKAAPAKTAPTKKAAQVNKATPVVVAPAKKAVAVKTAPPKVTPAKKIAPAKVEAQPTVVESATEPKAVVVKETKAAKLAAAKAEQIAAAIAAQVITPIGGAFIPTVRKAVPGKKVAPKHRTIEEDESTWTKEELNRVRKILTKDAAELIQDIAIAEEKFHHLIMDSGEGAGDDQADAGTKTFEREHEMSILSNKRDLLDQTNHALARLDAKTYGLCETCGRPIGKFRLLEANPRASLCMPCREKEDRS
jgi:RNA polymerase-binding protein DksA